MNNQDIEFDFNYKCDLGLKKSRNYQAMKQVRYISSLLINKSTTCKRRML